MAERRGEKSKDRQIQSGRTEDLGGGGNWRLGLGNCKVFAFGEARVPGTGAWVGGLFFLLLTSKRPHTKRRSQTAVTKKGAEKECDKVPEKPGGWALRTGMQAVGVEAHVASHTQEDGPRLSTITSSPYRKWRPTEQQMQRAALPLCVPSIVSIPNRHGQDGALQEARWPARKRVQPDITLLSLSARQSTLDRQRSSMFCPSAWCSATLRASSLSGLPPFCFFLSAPPPSFRLLLSLRLTSYAPNGVFSVLTLHGTGSLARSTAPWTWRRRREGG